MQQIFEISYRLAVRGSSKTDRRRVVLDMQQRFALADAAKE
jgi:hypothetical protein